MTEQHLNTYTACMLIPFILGLIGLALLYITIGKSKAEYIQNDLNYKSNQLLKEQQIGGVFVNVDGRNAVLMGNVESKARSVEIENVISSLAGIRAVENQLQVVESFELLLRTESRTDVNN